MKWIRHSLLAALLAASQTDAAITLSNLSAAQREGTKLVDIYFDAVDSADSSVGVSVAVANGGVELADAATFSGDIGSDVPTGTNLHVVWDGGAGLNDTVTSNLSFTLTVSPAAVSGMGYIPAGTNVVNDPNFSYTLTSGNLFMDATEITKTEWDLVDASAWGVYTSSGSGYGWSHPVQAVSWYEAAAWCNARSVQDGLTPCYYGGTSWFCDFSANGYRLPTVMEWEYAARGGASGWLYPWGNTISTTNANCEVNGYTHPGFGGVTSPVESFAPNGYGLYDMAGNVWEWCWDISGANRLLKGGSFLETPNALRNGHYGLAPPGNQGDFIGFRTVRNAPAPTTQTKTIPFDSRDYELEVVSDHGSPDPMPGVSSFAWMASVTCSIGAVVNEGGTNYTCAGWSGTGSVPAGGTTNAVAVVLSNLVSTITWNWVTDDSDFDGMDDDWERAFFSDLDQAATNDFDGDGQADFAEYIAGTNPTNPASLFELVPGVAGADRIKLEWMHAPGRTYNIYWTPNLQHTPFTNLESNIAYPRNAVTVTPTQAQGFFKADVSK